MSILSRFCRKSIFGIAMFLACAVFSSCTGNEDSELHVLEAVNEGIDNSNLVVGRSTTTIMATMNEKLKDPATSTKSGIWYPKARYIQQLSDNAFNYIETLKNLVKMEAGLESDDGKEVYNEKDRKVVERVFITNGNAKELYTTLKKYKQDVLSVDRKIDEVFKDNIQLASESFISSSNNSEEFGHFFFSKTSPVAAIALLNHIQNEIRQIENRMIQFCHENCRSTRFIDTFEWPVIAQDRTYLRSGEKIEITAGIGEFTKGQINEITINGKSIEVNETGLAIAKVNVPTKPGKHYLLVKIIYIDKDGKIEEVTKNIEYIVEEPCN